MRAGQRYRPTAWPDGASCAVALSFDSDHETNELRDQGLIPPALSDLTEMEVLDLENILTQFKAAINDLNQRVTHLEKTY